jgi:hypothetical protein
VVGVPSSRRAVGRCGWQRDGTAHMQCDLTASYACLPVPSCAYTPPRWTRLSAQPSSSLANEDFNHDINGLCIGTHIVVGLIQVRAVGVHLLSHFASFS